MMGTKYYRLCAFLFLAILLSGCAEIKEVCKGAIGVSTQVLEDGRKDAIKKEFNIDLITCHNRARSILKDSGAYIYCDDLSKDMIAVYISEEDTTPVGIFFTSTGKNTTLLEISSPSIYGKETIAKVIFESLLTGITKQREKGLIDATKTKEVGK
ncbi:MAG: hypothetical protein PHO03_05650 [Candidatus Omnitrophica bacterium]|nr:hypothetical protein [Candidatus Omnitrophota bacterium]